MRARRTAARTAGCSWTTDARASRAAKEKAQQPSPFRSSKARGRQRNRDYRWSFSFTARHAGPCCNPSDAVVAKASGERLLTAVDVPEIDQDLGRHHFSKPMEIQGAELLPLGHDHKRIGALGASIRIGRIRYAGENLTRLFHPCGIIGANF